MMPTAQEIIAIEANLFPLVRSIVHEKPDFPWHRDRSGKLTAGRAVSSQALAVDFFGSVDRLRSCDAIVAAWVRHLGLTFSGGPWSIELERSLFAHLLGEPRPTQIDGLANGR